MSHVMKKESYFSLGLNGETIRLKKNYDIKTLSKENVLPTWIKSIVDGTLEEKNKSLEKRL